jgi:hypothetical protein
MGYLIKFKDYRHNDERPVVLNSDACKDINLLEMSLSTQQISISFANGEIREYQFSRLSDLEDAYSKILKAMEDATE